MCRIDRASRWRVCQCTRVKYATEFAFRIVHTHVSEHTYRTAYVAHLSYQNETRLRICERCFFEKFTFASLVDDDDVMITKKMKELYASLNKESSLNGTSRHLFYLSKDEKQVRLLLACAESYAIVVSAKYIKSVFSRGTYDSVSETACDYSE